MSKARKATSSLHEDVLAAVDDAVHRGAAPSKNAFVEEALRRELREVGRQERRRRWEQATRDPLLMADVRQVESDFAEADAETAARIV